MVGFVIPFKPKRETQDWKEDNRLLERTVKCLLNQTDPHFKVIVVYTDKPAFEVEDARVEMHQMPYPFVELEEVPHYKALIQRFGKEKLVVRRWDKGRKISFGCQLAKTRGCDYIMAVDSDDLVSNKLVAFIGQHNRNKQVPGWYIRKGYFFNEASEVLTKQWRKMNHVNGSTHILRADLVRIPDFNSDQWEDFNLFTDHGWIKGRMLQEYNERLEPIPFYGVIYIAHENNISGLKQLLNSGTLKAKLKRLLLKKSVTKSILAEFNLRK